jgi:hypothetical protein
MLLAAMAGGMAWGIRGQYGHETGAMIAGLLVSLVLTLLLCPNAGALRVARAVAWCTIAMGFGGSMTYGQTVGLTHNLNLLGNWEALRWGMLGLAFKGGTWIGFAGVFLGMGLGGTKYKVREMALITVGLLGAYHLGVWLLNSPMDIANKTVPRFYFSDYWYWHEDPNADLKPRAECWGGLLLAWALLTGYVGLVRKDGLAWRMALWGSLGGMLGFPFGQSLQAYHAWNPELYKTGIWTHLDPYMNWWNWMETTFGAVMGATLGLGLWLHRKRIDLEEHEGETALPGALEAGLFVLHVALLAGVSFLSMRWIDRVYDLGLMMGVVPLIAVTRGRWWPYAMVFPITLLPIAGKTILEMVFRDNGASMLPLWFGEATDHGGVVDALGWLLYFIIPIGLAVAAMVWGVRQADRGQLGRAFAWRALLLTTWIYFLLNHAFFKWAWPWSEWTGRTPNGICFMVCAIGLTVAAVLACRAERRELDVG